MVIVLHSLLPLSVSLPLRLYCCCLSYFWMYVCIFVRRVVCVSTCQHERAYVRWAIFNSVRGSECLSVFQSAYLWPFQCVALFVRVLRSVLMPVCLSVRVCSRPFGLSVYASARLVFSLSAFLFVCLPICRSASMYGWSCVCLLVVPSETMSVRMYMYSWMHVRLFAVSAVYLFFYALMSIFLYVWKCA
jgi:hypothetical protein